MRNALPIFFFSLLLCTAVFAHGFDNTQSVTHGNRTFEFGITEAAPAAGQRMGMSFSVDEGGIPLSSDEASIRISKGDDIMFISNGFRLSNETILTMSYTFPEPGTYDVDFSLMGESATYHVTVKRTGPPVYLWIVVAAVVGWQMGMLLERRKRKR
jgi:hypothetical protein